MGTQKKHLDETVLLGTQLVQFVHDIISNLDRAVNRGHKQTDSIIMDFAKIVSEYDQEIPQSQTADNPVAPRGRAAQPSQDTRKTN